MKLLIVTIVKNGLPWVSLHYPEFRKLRIPWEWHVVEGTALAENCTSWCSAMKPGLSTDGTSEYLDSIASDDRVYLHRSEVWHGKIEMVNAPLRHLHESCILFEVDSDELWTAEKIHGVYQLLTSNKFNCAYFTCRYFLGPDIVITSRNTFGNRGGEWLRAWRIAQSDRFATHEPPVIDRFVQVPATNAQTEKLGLIFDHMAYATEAQIRFKQEYYGSSRNALGKLYENAVDGWKRLQANTVWPAKVRDFLPFVNDDCVAERVQ